jgi:cytoskeleton protein RodZ
MAAAAGGDPRAGIGTRLRAAREKKCLTILQAAEKMHVDSRILESLEAEDFAALGAPVYARGHLRHYAELVGESPVELQELYVNSTKAAPAQPDLTRIARMEPQGDPGKLVGPSIVVLVAVAVIGTLWWLISLSGDGVQPTAFPGKTESDSAGIPAGPQAAARMSAATAVDTGVANETPAAAGPATPATPGPKPTAVATSAAKGAPPAVTRTATALPPAAAASTAAPNAVAPRPTPRSKDGELTLKFSSDSWAEVYDAAGQRLFYDVGTASSAHTIKGPAPLRIILGNASGVAIEYNGRPAPIPAAIQPDGSARFVINARGRTAPANPVSDGE